jgi:uncharacterized membrane protein YfcA
VSDVVRSSLAVLSGFLVGLLSGTMGLGGGILLVPLMVLGFGFTQHLAQGTSLAALIPTSIVGAVTYYREGNVDRRTVLWLSAGGIPAVLAGSVVAVQLPRELLARLFGLLLLYSGYRIWAGLRPPRAQKVD